MSVVGFGWCSKRTPGVTSRAPETSSQTPTKTKTLLVAPVHYCTQHHTTRQMQTDAPSLSELTLCAFRHAPSAVSTIGPLSTSSCSKLLRHTEPCPNDPSTPQVVAAAICQSRRPGEAFRGEPWGGTRVSACHNFYRA